MHCEHQVTRSETEAQPLARWTSHCSRRFMSGYFASCAAVAHTVSAGAEADTRHPVCGQVFSATAFARSAWHSGRGLGAGNLAISSAVIHTGRPAMRKLSMKKSSSSLRAKT